MSDDGGVQWFEQAGQEQEFKEREMKQIAAAFVKAKREFAPALKTSTNPHFKTKYADLGACLEAVSDALLANGIAVYQETALDDHGVTVETVFMHESGEILRCGKLHVPAGKQDPQGYGSALTYARRYSVMAACGIAPEDDDGNAASKPANKPASTKAFDMISAEGWIRGAADAATMKSRGREAYAKAATQEQKDRIAAIVRELEQASMASA